MFQLINVFIDRVPFPFRFSVLLLRGEGDGGGVFRKLLHFLKFIMSLTLGDS